LAAGEIDEAMIETCINDLTDHHHAHNAKFLALWRFLQEQLAKQQSWFDQLPADTRNPDHTIWNHMDTVAAFFAALSDDHEAALLTFSVGPVQRFIASARSVRDLWSGSTILAWLTYQAMKPIIDDLGPAAIIFPSLRGLPWLDADLAGVFAQKMPKTDKKADTMKSPCVPNRFLALIPWNQGEADGNPKSFSVRCRSAADAAWNDLCHQVHAILDKDFRNLCGDWDKLWQQQVTGFFDIRTSVLSRKILSETDCAHLFEKKSLIDNYPEIKKLRRLESSIPTADRPPFPQDRTGEWAIWVELAGRLHEASRTVRTVPTARAVAPVPPKCSLMGDLEQMGPALLTDSREFWEQLNGRSIRGISIRKNERMCAVSLVKRFAPAVMEKKWPGSSRLGSFSDTATVAAKVWLKNHNIDPDDHPGWNGQWLHWSKQTNDGESVPDPLWQAIREARKKDAPPAYYAILMMDADRMGDWLRGENPGVPTVGQVIHPKLTTYYRELGKEDAVAALNMPRPVTPALHAAISQALANFALHVVPEIISKYDGTPIYAGGDDVLALLPARQALTCASALRKAFQGSKDGNGGAPEGYYRTSDGRDLIMMGPTATLSAGISICHYKEDLRTALASARDAEKRAKRAGRNLLVLAANRRSGEHAQSVCPWAVIPLLESLMSAFSDSEGEASDRWVYHLRSEAETLAALDESAIRAEIRRLAERSDPNSRQCLEKHLRAHNSNFRSVGDALSSAYAEYRSLLQEVKLQSVWPPGLMSHPLGQFICLCQTASFLVRGKEER